MKRYLLIVAGAAILLLSGCMVGPEICEAARTTGSRLQRGDRLERGRWLEERPAKRHTAARKVVGALRGCKVE